MFKRALITLLLLSTTATFAEFKGNMDTVYIKKFDQVLSRARDFDEDKYLLASYDARIFGSSAIGSTYPGENVKIVLRITNDYNGTMISHAEENTRAIAAESCVNMANQLRLSSKKKWALKMSVPSSTGTYDAESNTRTYIVGMKYVYDTQWHLGFDCELTKAKGARIVTGGNGGITSG
jgi:hypothetical protein